MPDALNLKVEWEDTDFNKTWGEYLKWNTRQPAEIVNGKLYFIALQAMRNTKTVDKDLIRQVLNAPSNKYPRVPLGAILINKQRRSQHKKGLYGEKMAAAMSRLIRSRQSRTQFLRSGWIESLKVLDWWNHRNTDNLRFVTRFAPKKPAGIRQFGKTKGACIPARPERIRVWGVISNRVGAGKQASPTVQPLILDGLKKAVRLEIQSMLVYIRRKYEEQHNKIKRTGKAN